jgi:ferric-chelate reductase
MTIVRTDSIFTGRSYTDLLMSQIRLADCDGGWQAGQHVRLCVFFSGRVFESHPLTILSAPSASSCLSLHALYLGARVCGDWTRALNLYAKDGVGSLSKEEKDAAENVGTQVQVMVDGPYGGCSIDLGRYESVLLVSGGSGATFAVGLLDDIVGRCVKLGRRGGERTKRIEFAWCTRSFGESFKIQPVNFGHESSITFIGSIQWFVSHLMDIATAAAGSSIDLHLSIFVTCLCNPEDVPPIPNLDVTIHRPSVTTILQDLLFPSSSRKSSEEGVTTRSEKDSETPKTWVPTGGGVAVCASGPETMTREAQNAVARMGMTRGVELGGIALHTELFSM